MGFLLLLSSIVFLSVTPACVNICFYKRKVCNIYFLPTFAWFETTLLDGKGLLFLDNAFCTCFETTLAMSCERWATSLAIFSERWAKELGGGGWLPFMDDNMLCTLLGTTLLTSCGICNEQCAHNISHGIHETRIFNIKTWWKPGQKKFLTAHHCRGFPP